MIATKPMPQPFSPFPYLLLILLCLCLYLPGLTTLPPTDRDESRFAQASKQMLESGDFVDIRFQDTPRYKKPIGIYWLQAAAVTLAGGSEKAGIGAYRIPSAVGACLAVLLTFHFGQGWFGRRSALLAAALLASCLLLTVEAHLAKTDAMLLACIVAMQGCLGNIYLEARQGKDAGMATALVFWLACGAGVLIKGPLPLLMALLTLGALAVADRNFAFLRPLRSGRGLLLLAAMILPWLLAINQASQGAFVKTAVGDDLLPKLLSGQESHGAPPGYYALLFTPMLWPGSIFALWALRPTWQLRASWPVRFCLAWIIPCWLMFELIPTKLPHYVLPTLPAIFLLIANALLGDVKTAAAPPSRLTALLKGLLIALWVLSTLILGLGPALAAWQLNGAVLPATLLAACVSLLLPLWLLRYGPRGNFPMAACGGIVSAMLIVAPALHTSIPSLRSLWISREVTTLISRQPPQTESSKLAAVGFHEPSLVFLLGTATRLTNAAGAASSLARDGYRYALISDSKTADFIESAKSLQLAVTAKEQLRGFNYSKGKWLNLTLYEQAPGSNPNLQSEHLKEPLP